MSITIGIDATNLLQGGGRTHLIELLNSVDIKKSGITKIVVWARTSTLEKLPDRPWLKKVTYKQLEGGLVSRSVWQRHYLDDELNRENCDVLFVPGGNIISKFRPVLTMSRNMLPFEWRELRRYGISLQTLKLVLLRFAQIKSLRKADGVVFLTKYAFDAVQKVTGELNCRKKIIAHGVNPRFFLEPRKQKSIDDYSVDTPFRIIYISIIDEYKHQCRVVDVVKQLRNDTGWPLFLHLIGPKYSKSYFKLEQLLSKYPDNTAWVKYHGPMQYDDLHEVYLGADLGLFASTCENLPNILIEKMAAGLPIACSDRGPMPEVLGDAGVYFDSENNKSMMQAISDLVQSPDLRTKLAHEAFERSKSYTWADCADQTMQLLIELAANANNSKRFGSQL